MTIKVYSTATCPYCIQLKEWLGENKIEFDSVMVDTDKAAAEEMMKISGSMSVPVTVVTSDDGKKEVVVGFDKEKLGKLLDIK
tara:strand:- start:821 stop:1069 length:249 start_codon:yes stop_codon:yes gene_type:complete